MSVLYPMRFQPIFRRYLWGGRRLESELEKQLPPEGNDYAESWEIVDRQVDQSVVSNGELQGWTLGNLVEEYGKELLGKHHPQPQFPLLFKFLDCQQDLSVQVHPNDEQAARLNPPDLGKTEAWVILAAEPGSRFYAGFQPGVDQASFERALLSGTVEPLLHKVEPSAGDCVFIPAGTVHALGKGLLVAEIQQASDTTFRLFDWNRLGPDGRPRDLHLKQGLDVIDFGRGPVNPQSPVGTIDLETEQLIECEKFRLRRISFTKPHRIGGDERCHIIAVVQGAVRCENVVIKKGETMLLPACCGQSSLAPNATSDRTVVLEMCLPD